MRKKLLIILLLTVLCLIVWGAVISKILLSFQLKENISLGNKFLIEQKYEEAILAFKNALELKPKNIEGRLGLAKAYIKVGKSEQSEKLLKEAISFRNNNPEPYTELSRLYVSLGNVENAIIILEQGYNKTRNSEIKRLLDELKAEPLPPKFSVDSGEYKEEKTVELKTSDNKGQLFYTLDGAEPTKNSTKYTVPIKVGAGKTVIRAIVIAENGKSSKEAKSEYIVKLPAKLLIPHKFDKLWGYVDTKNNTIIQPQFQKANYFSQPEGLAAVKKEGKVGFIDVTGKVIIPFKYEDFSKTDVLHFSFSEGLCAVIENSKFGFIDTHGNYVIPLQFDINPPASIREYTFYHPYFKQGYANVMKNGKCGLIDKTGKFIFEPKFSALSPLSTDELALAQIDFDEKWGFVDKAGNWVIEPIFVYKYGVKGHISNFNSGLACVSLDGNKYGYIDRTGNFVIPPQFDSGTEFSDGKTATVTRDGETFKIDIKGTRIN